MLIKKERERDWKGKNIYVFFVEKLTLCATNGEEDREIQGDKV